MTLILDSHLKRTFIFVRAYEARLRTELRKPQDRQDVRVSRNADGACDKDRR